MENSQYVVVFRIFRNKDREDFIPIKVVLGDYCISKGCFIDDNGNEYVHISYIIEKEKDGDEPCCFGYLHNINDDRMINPNLSIEDMTNNLLTSVKKEKYFSPKHTNQVFIVDSDDNVSLYVDNFSMINDLLTRQLAMIISERFNLHIPDMSEEDEIPDKKPDDYGKILKFPGNNSNHS